MRALFRSRVWRRLAAWGLLNLAVMMGLAYVQGGIYRWSADPFRITHSPWWKAFFPWGMLIVFLPFLWRMHRIRKAVHEAEGLACLDCLYDLGHGGAETGRCPECGAEYTLTNVQETWREFVREAR